MVSVIPSGGPHGYTLSAPSPIALYAEMREGILADHTDYASKPLKDHLKGASIRYRRRVDCTDIPHKLLRRRPIRCSFLYSRTR